jgi:hypothetical protein
MTQLSATVTASRQSGSDVLPRARLVQRDRYAMGMRPLVSPTASFQGGCTPCNHCHPGWVELASQLSKRASSTAVKSTPIAAEI